MKKRAIKVITVIKIVAFALVLIAASWVLVNCYANTDNMFFYGSFRSDIYHRLVCSFDMFPKTIKKEWTVLDYHFWYLADFLDDRGYIYLDICFNSEEEYEAELERVLSVKSPTYKSYDVFVENTQDFNYQAFELMGREHGSNNPWQYVLVMPDENRIVYIFLYLAPIKSAIPIEFYPEPYIEEYAKYGF